MKTLKEIQERIGVILADLENEEKRNSFSTEELTALQAESEALVEEQRQLNELIETREQEMRDALANGKVIEQRMKEEKSMDLTKEQALAKPEYRSAYFKNLAGEALSEVEARAFTETTSTFGGALPIETQTAIMSNIVEAHPIVGDITSFHTGTILELTIHSAIAAGDAASVAEGVANADEENTYITVTLSGKDFSKTAKVSYALGKMSGGALEAYLIQELSERLGAALAADIVAQIVSDMAAGNKVNSAAVKKTTFTELNGMFALLRQARGKVVYATEATIYNYLTSLVDDVKRPIFQPDAQADIAGYLLGAQVKVEDAVADNVFLIGAPSMVTGNYVQDIMIEQARDIEAHKDVYSGYARFECKLRNSTSFAQLTVIQA